MKVTVKEFLNVRVGKASLNAPTYQYLAPGTVLDVEDELYEGDRFESISQWLKDGAGNFYWVGGTNYPLEVSSVQLESAPQSYEYWHLKNFGIKEIHDKGYRGQGINVCVIDSGIASGHSGFNYTKIVTKCFIDQSITNDGLDNEGHGTICAGVIAANGEKVAGVAYEANMIIYKGYSYYKEKEIDLIYAMENVPSSCDVVSISYAFGDPANFQRLKKAIEQLIKDGKIVVVGHGNNNNTPNLLSSIEGVISVGAVDEKGEYKQYSCTTGTIHILAPGVNIQTTFMKGDYGAETGTSLATPFVASICAMMKQINKNTNAFKALELIRNSNRVSKDGLIRIIDPLLIIDKIRRV